MLPGVAIALTLATFGLGLAGGVFMLQANGKKLDRLRRERGEATDE